MPSLPSPGWRGLESTAGEVWGPMLRGMSRTRPIPSTLRTPSGVGSEISTRPSSPASLASLCIASETATASNVATESPSTSPPWPPVSASMVGPAPQLQREDLPAYGLVQAVLAGIPQGLEAARGEAVDEHGGPRDIVHSIGDRHGRRELCAGLRCERLEVWDEEHGLNRRGAGNALRDPLAAALDRDLHAAVDGRRHVVRVPLRRGGHLQQTVLRARVGQVLPRQHQARPEA